MTYGDRHRSDGRCRNSCPLSARHSAPPRKPDCASFAFIAVPA